MGSMAANDEETPRERLQRAMADLGVTVEATFVPWTKSRSFKADAKISERSLNWRVTLKRDTRTILTTDYTAGIGHAPGYAHHITADVALVLERETEHGKACRFGSSTGHPIFGKAIEVDACDVVYSLVSDADVIDYPTFESWASDLGYDTDSRTAKKTYRACLETALALRAGVGDAGLTALRDACEGY